MQLLVVASMGSHNGKILLKLMLFYDRVTHVVDQRKLAGRILTESKGRNWENVGHYPDLRPSEIPDGAQGTW